MLKSVSLQRTVCDGICPAYTVTVDEAGKVTWQGEMFVSMLSEHGWQLSPAQFTALKHYILNSSFFSYEDAYEQWDITCLSSCITVITLTDGRAKRISHYHGDMSAPPLLTRFENRLDKLIGTKAYIGTDEERLPWKKSCSSLQPRTFQGEL